MILVLRNTVLLVGLAVVAALVAAIPLQPASATPTEHVDVVVYEASSGGVGAALAAARQGRQVLLVEPSHRVGGMLTNGVTADLFRFNASTGMFDEHRRRAEAIYAERGEDLALVRRGLFNEPDVALAAVTAMLEEEPGIEVVTGWWLASVTREGRDISSLTITDGTDSRTVTAGVYIDASPVGDLLGASGQPGLDWVLGREGQQVYGESFAPEASDLLQQTYSYRMVFQVQDPEHAESHAPPTHAQDLPRYRAFNRIATPWNCTIDGRVYLGVAAQRCLPNGKIDINLGLVGFNHHYPLADRDTRLAVERRLMDFALGWLHFLRTEGGYPELGLPIDDYVDNHGVPSVLYVREGRRAIGEYTFTQHDARMGSVTPKPDSVAIGDYGLDAHATGPVGAIYPNPTPTAMPARIVRPGTPPSEDEVPTAVEGAFWARTDPYQVPYGTIVPRNIDNLLVPVPVSASHVGYSTLRMEPVRMNLGAAAGTAAAMALDDGIPPREVDVNHLQDRLLDAGQALIYHDALDHTAPDFPASQRLRMHLATTFWDVGLDAPHATGIAAMSKAGVIAGFDDGSFRGDTPLTRAQASTMLARAGGLEPVSVSAFPDVDGIHAPNINALTQEGIISGYADGTFRPSRTLTRGQLASLVARLLDLPPAPPAPYRDLDGTVHADAIARLHAAGIVGGYSDGTYRPGQAVTRAQIATMLHLATGS